MIRQRNYRQRAGCAQFCMLCVVHVRRVIHVIVHNGLTVVEGVLVVVHTFTWPFIVAISS